MSDARSTFSCLVNIGVWSSVAAVVVAPPPVELRPMGLRWQFPCRGAVLWGWFFLLPFVAAMVALLLWSHAVPTGLRWGSVALRVCAGGALRGAAASPLRKCVVLFGCGGAPVL